MPSDRAERKLVAILAADVVGYSRLMGADEEGTLAQLKAHRRELIDPKIKEHRGRIVKTTGDGILAEFPSVVDAVRCAVEAQRGMVDRNADISQDRRIEFRVGVNIGDIIVDGGDIHGDGVNIAARLQALAEPGGICVSRAARDHIRDRLPYEFADLGEHAVKNIARPIRVFGLTAKAVAALPGIATAPPVSPPRRPAKWMLAVAAVIVIAAIGAGVWRTGIIPSPQATAPSASAVTAPRLSIIVLPFENLSIDPDQDYFAEGLTQDVTTDLSHLPDSFVIAHETAMTYKGRAVDVKQIGRELGVRYVLEGSVQRAGDEIRLNVQLISVETGAHLWADRFAGDPSKLSELQDDITARLARALDIQLTEAESRRAEREAASDLDAFTLAIRGAAALNRPLSLENLMEARGFFERALQIDPQSRRALVGLARVFSTLANARLSTDFDADIARANELLARALEAHPGDAYAHVVKGGILRVQKRFAAAMAEYETAITNDRNLATAYANLGMTRTFLGRPEEAIAPIEMALRLSPQDPSLYLWQFYMCAAYTDLAQDGKAIEWCRKSVTGAPFWFAYVDLASAYAWEGNRDEARDAVQELLKLKPGYTLKKLAAEDWSDEPAFAKQYARIVEGARMAGLPE